MNNVILIAFLPKIEDNNAYNKRKLYTKPINPETSTKENPINDHLIRLLLIEGLREMANTKKANIIPTPIATPVKHIIGILEAKYLNPSKIIDNLIIYIF